MTLTVLIQEIMFLLWAYSTNINIYTSQKTTTRHVIYIFSKSKQLKNYSVFKSNTYFYKALK